MHIRRVLTLAVAVAALAGIPVLGAPQDNEEESRRDQERRSEREQRDIQALVQMVDASAEGTQPVPADIGDVVLMTNMTPHRSTDNTSGLIRWATDLRYNAPEAGDYGPGEAGFLARSARTPDRVLTDCREFNHLRKEHVPQSKVDRSWLKYDEETFADASKRVDKALPKLR